MPRRSRTFRVFVSSTFSDLKAERNALQDRVFPKLRELCERHGCRFQAIDLRWGVTSEAQMDQQAMNICLREIERCQDVSPRPNFIVLLGDRYGAQPAPPQIAKTEFNHLMEHLSNEEKARLKFDEEKKEIRQGEGNSWYRLDTNARPLGESLPHGEYVLLPRLAGSPFESYENWEPEEREVLALLRKAASRAYPDPKAKERKKYFQSATHQEIEAGALASRDDDPEPEKHVLCWQREFAREAVEKSTDPGRADFIDLQPSHKEKDLEAWKREAPIDDAVYERQKELKQELSDRLSDENIVVHKNTAWPWEPSETYLDAMCEFFERRLTEIMEREMAHLQEIAPMDAENDAHLAFAEERTRHFVGRRDHLTSIRDYLERDDPHPLFVHGVSGCGKTALMAKAWEICAAENEKHKSGEAIFGRMIGASPGSSSLRILLQELGRQIEAAFGVDESNIPDEINPFYEWFESRLKLAEESDRKLILFLDALDQLQDFEDAHCLHWLPLPLPKNVRIVVSILERPDKEAGGCYRNAEKRFKNSKAQFLPVSVLDSDEASRLFAKWFSKAKRQVTPSQFEMVAKAVGEDMNPFFLRVVFEEMCRWKNWEKPIYSPKSATEAIDLFLDYLADPKRHGPLLVERSLAYIAAGRHGLAEDELLDILAYDHEFWSHFVDTSYHHLPLPEPWQTKVDAIRSPEEKKQFLKSPETFPREKRKIPVALWSRLNHDLDSFLTEQEADGGVLLNCYHRLLSEHVGAKFLRAAKKERHHCLADYFDAQPLWLGKEDKVNSKIPNVRKVSELVHHLMKVDDWSRLLGQHPGEGLLNDIYFYEAKCLAGQARRYLEELELAISRRQDEAAILIQREIENYQRKFVQYFRNGDKMAQEPLPPKIEILGNQEASKFGEQVPANEKYMREIFRALASNTELVDQVLTEPLQAIQLLYNTTNSKDLRKRLRPELVNPKSNQASFCRYSNDRTAQISSVGEITFPAPNEAFYELATNLSLTTFATISGNGRDVQVVDMDENVSTSFSIDGFCDRAIDVSQSGEKVVFSANSIDPKTGSGLFIITNSTKEIKFLSREESITALQILPCENVVVYTNRSNNLCLLNLVLGIKSIPVQNTGIITEKIQYQAKRDRVILLGKLIAEDMSKVERRSLAAFDLESGKRLWVFDPEWTVEGLHLPPIGDIGVIWGGEDMDGAIRIFDFDQGVTLHRLKRPTGCRDAKLNFERSRLVVASQELYIIDLGRFLARENHHSDQESKSNEQNGKRSWSPSCIKTLKYYPHSLEITPEGAFALLSGGYNKKIERIDLRSSFEANILESNSLPFCIRVSENGNSAVVSDTNCLRVFDFEANKYSTILEGHIELIWDIVMHKKWIATGGADGTIRIWHSETYQLLCTLDRRNGDIRALQFSKHLRQLISASERGEICFWGEDWAVQKATHLPYSIRSIKISTSGTLLAVGSEDGSLSVFEIPSMKNRFQKNCLHESSITAITFDSSSELVLTTDLDGILILTNLNNNSTIYRKQGSKKAILTLSSELSDGTIVGSGNDQRLFRWHLKSGHLVQRDKASSIRVFDELPMESKLIGCGSGAISEICANDFSVHSKWNGSTQEIHSVCYFLADGERVISDSHGYGIHRYAVASRKADRSLRISKGKESGDLTSINSIARAVVIQNGEFVIHSQTGPPPTIDVSNLSSSEVVTKFTKHRGTIFDIKCSARHGVAASLSDSETRSEVYLWRIFGGDIVSHCGCLSSVSGICTEYSSAITIAESDGQLIVGSNRGLVYQLGPQMEKPQRLCRISDWPISVLLSSRDGSKIIVGDEGGGIGVFCTRLEKVIFSKRIHRAEVTSLVSLPDSEYCLSGSEDRSVIVFRVQDGVVFGRYIAENPIRSLSPCFSKMKLAVDTNSKTEFVRIFGLSNAFKPSNDDRHKSSDAGSIDQLPHDVQSDFSVFSLPVATTQCLVGIASDWNENDVKIFFSEKVMDEWQQVEPPIDGRIGKNGLAWGRGLHPQFDGARQKQEGDLRTPAGVFKIGAAWGYSNTIRKNPAMAYSQITSRDLWVDDPLSPHYNLHLRLDHDPNSPDELQRQMIQDSLPHSLKLFVCHNEPPKSVPYAGSAIFIRIWDEDGKKPTKGGIGVSESDLETLISRINPEQNPVLILLPATEYVSLHDAWKLP